MKHHRTNNQLDKKIRNLNLDIAEKGMERKVVIEEDQHRNTLERQETILILVLFMSLNFISLTLDWISWQNDQNWSEKSKTIMLKYWSSEQCWSFRS